jgi:hypothetical protein
VEHNLGYGEQMYRFGLAFCVFAVAGCCKPSDTADSGGDDSGESNVTAQNCDQPQETLGYWDASESWGLLSTDDGDPDRKEYNPVAIADFDNDGDDDIVMAPRTGGVWLQRNEGDRLTSELIADFQDTMTLAVGDYDGDGWLDLLAGGRGANQALFRNLDGESFIDVTAQAGPFLPSKAANVDIRDASFVDFDSDGDLDLYLTYATSLVSGFDQPDLLLQNEDGVFSDVSDWLPEEARFGLGWQTLWSDLDLDGDLDAYVANADQQSHGPSRLLRNDGRNAQGDWVFSDLTDDCHCGWVGSAMGASAGDIDHDGYPDLFVTNTGPSPLLWNQQDLSFIDVAFAQGATAVPDTSYMTFGSVFFDADHDTWLDIVTLAGVLHHGTNAGQTTEQPDSFLFGSEDGFEDRAQQYGMADVGDGRGVAVGFVNDDDFLDIAITHVGAPSQLWLSQCTDARSLIVSLTGTSSNLWGMGARVVLETSGGTLVREINTSPGWAAASHPRAHFGLGEVRIETMTIYWPSGTVQSVDIDPTAQGWLAITEP